MAKLGDSGEVAASNVRRKTNRSIVIWVSVGLMVAMIAYLVIRSPDLGRSKAEKLAKKRSVATLNKQYKAHVTNPKLTAENEYQKALDTVKHQRSNNSPAGLSQKISPPSSLPPPLPVASISQAKKFNLERYSKANRKIRLAGHRGDGSSGQIVAGQVVPGFVMYRANGKKGSLNILHIANPGAKKTKVESGSANQQYQQFEASQNNNPAMVAARARLAQAQAQRRAMAKSLAPSPQHQNTVGLDPNAQWLYRAQNSKVKPDAPIVALHGKGRYWIAPGTIIRAVLVTAINTRLPGQIVARVTSNVYDSRYGRFLVIPAGSILQGSYNTKVKDGQNSVMAAFKDLITPAGGIVPLQGMSVSNEQGIAGVPGALHTHFWARMSVSLLYAVEASEMAKLSNSTVVSPNGTTTQNSMGAGAQIMETSANRQIKEMFALGPNITVKPGIPIALVINQGVEVPPIANAR